MDGPAFDALPPTILVVEDDPAIARLLRVTLETEGYTATIAHTGEEGIAFAQREVPQLVLLDLLLPGMDGFEVVGQLRAHARTAHIPVVILSARHDIADKVRAFECQVDDYLTKPFDSEELMARIRTQLRHVHESLLSPLTGLPAGLRVERAIEQQLATGAAWALLYVDLDHFKAYNDVYGFLQGNELIRTLGRVAADSLRDFGNGGDFLGHIGGDDFLIITTPDRVDTLCRDILARWSSESRAFYHADDLQRGTLVALDRQGARQVYPLVSVSIGIVTNLHRPIERMEEVSLIAAEVKKMAKAQSGNSYFMDQRGTGHEAHESQNGHAALADLSTPAEQGFI